MARRDWLGLFVVSASLLAGGCKARQELSSAVKDDSSNNEVLTQLGLGFGVKLPPLKDVSRVEPALRICVMGQTSIPKQTTATGTCDVGESGIPGEPGFAPLSTGTGSAQSGQIGNIPSMTPPASGASLTDDASVGGASVVDPTLLPATNMDGEPAPAFVDLGDENATASGFGLDAPTESGVFEGSVNLIQSASDVDRLFQTSGSASSSIPVLSGSLSAQLRNELRDTSSNDYLVVSIQYRGRLETFTKPEMDGALPGKEQFVEQCGNRFVARRQMGGYLYGVAKMVKGATSRNNDMQAAVQDLKTIYAPGIKAGADMRVANKTQQALSNLEFTIKKAGGSVAAKPVNFEGMMAKARSFVCSVVDFDKQAPLVVYLAKYNGVTGMPADLVPEESDLQKPLTRARDNLTRAQATIAEINSYPQHQKFEVQDQLKALNTYVERLGDALETCTSDAELCTPELRAVLAEAPPIRASQLPGKSGGELPWTAGTTYTVDVEGDALRCVFPQDSDKGQRIAKLFVQFVGNSLDGKADVSFQMRTGALFGALGLQTSPRHEVNTIELRPYIEGIVNNSLSRTQITEIFNNVVAQATGRDGKWQVQPGSCTPD